MQYLLPSRLTAKDARPFLKVGILLECLVSNNERCSVLELTVASLRSLPEENRWERKHCSCFCLSSLCSPSPTLESAFNAAGRPLEPAFYTGSPAYHNLVYEIFQKTRALEEEGQTTPKVGVASNEENGSKESVHHYWVKKETLANMLAEELSDKQVHNSNLSTSLLCVLIVLVLILCSIA